MTVLIAAGDVGAKRADPASMFRGCAAALSSGDVAFAQLETVVTDRGARSPAAKLAMRAPPAMMTVAREAGIGVMSFAGNHCLDWGEAGFADTLTHAAAAGITLCGAGANLAEARKPAVTEHGGQRFAFLAYSSILPEGYAATRSRPGCAPMWAHTLYEQIEHDQPGTPPRIHSYADRADLSALVADVKAARETADVVIVSLHWGVHMVEAALADYQHEVAHAAIEAGAAAIIGHHPHILKGVGFHRGAPIFYSLGNFAIEQPHIWDPEITKTESFRHLVSLNPGWSLEETYMLPPDTRMTGLARLTFEAGALTGAEFLPAWIEDDSAPFMLGADDPRFARLAGYLRKITASAGLKTNIEAKGDRLSLSPG